MLNRTIEVFIEKTEDGTYWGTSQNFEGIITTFGESLEELKTNFEEAFADHMELAKETNEDYANDYDNITFQYEMDISSFFELVPELKISYIAKKANMNESLVRQYKNGITAASQDQAKKIQQAVHELGRELLSVKF
ncbi:type II toxin-antitoxin system HicB family antitoxin [Epilithonimonas hispanica]|uniref:Type II toxin-antitoxin system HicB family antitoxin n=1 Tax=Epilithonimonas hispanica TaxID=358687 RepID=A0A3D9CIF7_9FLAO|nr:type II toxin-antitoxin system HicB family antitoxin [Epilithonimonas hispanica]REC65524.1 type II toxin-antitoxin system HicB family antitoxin [Epilithonimonas hispanica]